MHELAPELSRPCPRLGNEEEESYKEWSGLEYSDIGIDNLQEEIAWRCRKYAWKEEVAVCGDGELCELI